ncbi:MAG: DUF115 domain-containing protein [Cyanobacteria bacterium]|nr:DUF115 domain-containing protein [Cyanobacteriota bacterium]
MFFEKNCRALSLKDENYALLQQLKQTPLVDIGAGNSNIELVETSAGDYSLLYHNTPLHSLTGAVQESEQLIQAQCKIGIRSNHLLFGLGLGYMLQTLVDKSRNGKIMVYEPNLSLLRFVLENVDLAEYLSLERVHIGHTLPDFLSKFKDTYVFGDEVDALVLPGYSTLMQQDIEGIFEEVVRFVEVEKTQMRCGFYYNTRWHAQFFTNLQFMHTCRPFKDLFFKFQDKPALLVSAGPSLDRNIELIRKHKETMVVIAVGAALRPLLAAGIEPDFVSFLDYEGAMQQLAKLPAGTENINILTGPFSNEHSFSVPCRERYWMSYENYPQFSEWVDSIFDEPNPFFPSGSSVSITSLFAALSMGCNPVVMIGQDLAFHGTQQYAGDVHVSFDGQGNFELENTETQVGRKLHLASIEGQDGSMLQTSPDYLNILRQFQDIAEIVIPRLNRRVYNASTGGAFIPGYEHLDLDTIATQEKFTPFDKWENVPRFNSQERQKYAERVQHRVVRKLEKTLEESKSCQDKIQRARRYMNSSIQKGNALLAKYAPDVTKAREQLLDYLIAHSFVKSFLCREIFGWDYFSNKPPETLEDYRESLATELTYIERMDDIVSEQLRPWTEDALGKIRQVYQDTQVPV